MQRSTPRVAFTAALLLISCSFASPRTVLYEKTSAYNHIIVTQDAQGRRYLQFERNGALQSVVRPGRPLELELPYTQMAMVGLAFVPAPKRLLVVGLGGGSMPMFLRTVVPDARIDVVDIDPDVVDVARRYFGFREDDALRAHVGDAREFIESPGPAYDLIFLDAYGPASIPEHLATREFLAAVRARLTEGGAVVSNVWEQSVNTRFNSMERTYQVAFRQLYTFDVPSSANRILVGVVRSEKYPRAALEARAERLERERGVPFDLSQQVARGYEDATGVQGPGEVLTDAALRAPATAPGP
jgi:spermidine synthase